MGMISDLYNGDILEFECAGYADSDEYRGLVDNVAHAEQLLLQQLTDEEKALYQKLYEIQSGRKSKETVKERLKGVFK